MGAKAPASPPPVSSSSGQNSGGSHAASPFGNELPFFNVGEETISFGGRTWPLGDTRLFAARYDKYLNEPEDNKTQSILYRKSLAAISDKLSPRNPKSGVEKLREALPLLEKATSFEADANLCRTIINVIQTAYLSKDDGHNKRREIADMDKEISKKIYEMEVMQNAEEANKKSITNVGNNSKTNKAAPPKLRTSEERVRFQRLVKQIAELEAKKKLLEAAITVGGVQSKIHYQAFLVQMLLQRRFEHALIGCHVYNIVFSDGDTKLKLEKGSDAAKLFGETVGMPPTVSTIESVANEAVQDTKRAIEAVKGFVAQGNLTAANKRLCEAYFIGEFLEPIRLFPLAEKQKLASYARDIYRLYSAAQNKDYTLASALIESLSQRSQDFDSSKALGPIQAAMKASDLHLMSAHQALLEKDNDQAKVEITAAMEMWPLNPRLKEIDKVLMAGSEIIVAKNDFERLLREENYRQIFKEQYRFAPAIQGNAELEDAFGQIIGNIMKIEASLGKAREFKAMGHPYAAWEELRQMRDQKAFSTDPDLGNELANLSTQVADLANALETAQSLETNQEVGSALAWYLKARALYPASKYASAGVKRLLPVAFEKKD